jgi:hypothetical protein
MKRNEEVQKDFKDSIGKESSLNAAEICVKAKSGNHLRKIVLIANLVGIGLLLNSCMAGYVASEPVYVEYARPQRPSNINIWVDGNWAYNRQTHTYVQRPGYWENPRQGQNYVPGYWQATPRGKSWVKGQWKRQGRQAGKHNR